MTSQAYIPKLESDPWQICTIPDLGEFNGPEPRRQQIVDHHYTLSSDGKWRLWACIRGTAINRFIYGWSSDSLEKPDWQDEGIQLRASQAHHENVSPEKGTEQAGAPFFLKTEENQWLVFYHSKGFHYAQSTDGINFTRPLGNSTTISGGRDIMILKHREKYLSYATETTTYGEASYVLHSESDDLINWTPGKIVSLGGKGGIGPVDAESPFVVYRDGFFYLFRTSSITKSTLVYRSETHDDFGINDDSKLITEFPNLIAVEVISHQGQDYLSWYTLGHQDNPKEQGIRMAKLAWNSV